jgi:hypothetical protein
MGPA